MKKESFIIEGLAGKKALKGKIKINGAKNAALKAMAAAVLFDGLVELHNIPNTEDIDTMTKILMKLGAKVERPDHSLSIDPSTITSTTIDSKLAGVMRASVVLTGPLLARFGKASFPTPGGCVIGARPIDQFVKGYKEMGANVSEDDHNYTIEMMRDGNNNRSPITNIQFDKKTVGGTETLMMAAVLGNGTVTLNNCAQEPEIVNVAEWLNECGALIKGVGTEKIIIKGTCGKLLSPKVPYVAIPDRIEAGSYLILGALCASGLTIEDCRADHLGSLVDLLKKSGVPIEVSPNSISIKGNTESNSAFRSFDVSTKEYPGFATDFQPQIVTYLTQVSGNSIVNENIYEGRFKYVDDLQRMGAKIELSGSNRVSIHGPCTLDQLPVGEDLCAHDIRAGFAIVMAALVGKGSFTVNNTYFIDRGYEKLEERLCALGVNIRRVQSK